MSGRPLPRTVLETLLQAGLRAVDAGTAVRRNAGFVEGDRLVVLAAGKAAAPMAQALVEEAGPRIARGLVVTKDGHGHASGSLPVRETAHPVPDARSEAAGREALALAASGQAGETLVVLLSGGASSLLACPAPGLTLADFAATTDLLLASGADIEETNTVRKHLSALAGGQLARAWRGDSVRLLAISDVPGDRLDLIGSGPCSADPSRFADAWQVVVRRGFADRLPAAVRLHLEAGVRGERPETPGPGDPAFARVEARVVARNADALGAAEAAARQLGIPAAVDPEPLRGEASQAARGLLSRARAASAGASLLWFAGGETAVRLERAGRGGRNQELALAAALAIEHDPRAALLAAGTDGTDGPTDAAGAFADGGTVARGAALGLDARDALSRHDSYTFFAAEGGLLRTGPTGTNVMDVAFVSLG